MSYVESVGSGVAVVGETRNLIAGLPQDVSELFKDRFTFGMMEESCRKSLLSRYLSEEETMDKGRQGGLLHLTEGLSLHEVAHRTPGYEAGDLLRLIRAIRIELLAESKPKEEEQQVGLLFLCIETAHITLSRGFMKLALFKRLSES